ncbi:hypothetical protein [Macrococcus bovicus]|uniref:Uncharacterized protein n=1 Tax=Macrococcus bovicus TaxID=69968 RepID=A0A4R6C039_9STAP|nr:hypothetical protein [Macrococcus bovicus]TDM14306.1 hypothetical protein ERX55_05020 [Macrococcus bovicus]
MKKTAFTLLAATLMTTGLAGTAGAAAKPIALPDLKNKETVSQLKKGTYAVKGVKLNTTYAQAVKVLGTPINEYEIRSDEWAMVDASYGPVSFTAGEENRHAEISQMKLQSFLFDSTKKPVKLKDIQKNLGKSSFTDFYDNETKNIKDDFLTRTYGHLTINFERPTGEWTVSGYSTDYEGAEKVDPSQLKDADIKDPTIANIKAMTKGDYQLFGVKPGMSKAEVLTKIGDSSSDDIIRVKGKVKAVSATYGQSMNLVLSYNVPAGNQLKSLRYELQGDKELKLTDLEKHLGKATTVKNSSYTNEDGTEKFKVYTTTRTYGKHLTVNAEKSGKAFIVQSVSYQ